MRPKSQKAMALEEIETSMIEQRLTLKNMSWTINTHLLRSGPLLNGETRALLAFLRDELEFIADTDTVAAEGKLSSDLSSSSPSKGSSEAA